MTPYTRLNLNERRFIEQELKTNKSINFIARALKRSKSTVSEEVRRCGMNKNTYRATRAQADAGKKRHLLGAERKIVGQLKDIIETMLFQHWSPEQVCGALKRRFLDDPAFHLCHETIYRYVYRSRFRDLFVQCLRKKRKKRRRRHKIKRGGIRNRVSISQRPREANDRSQAGHWEGDLIIGKDSASAIGTLVDRKTRYVLLVPIQARDSLSVVQQFAKALNRLPSKLRLSLTYDQGTEMSRHEKLTELTGIPVFFAHASSPWERGSNENTNGLLREFFPKKTDLACFSEEDLMQVEKLLNGRPRKVLEYSTPKEQLERILAFHERGQPFTA